MSTDYVHENSARLEKELVGLRQQRRRAEQEAEDARGSHPDTAAEVEVRLARIAAAEAEVGRLKSQISYVGQLVRRVNARYPYFETRGFEHTLGEAELFSLWEELLETCSEAGAPGTVLVHDEVLGRLPIQARKAYAKAVSTGLFSGFRVCSLLVPDPDYPDDEPGLSETYLFGTITSSPSRKDEYPLFEIARWNWQGEVLFPADAPGSPGCAPASADGQREGGPGAVAPKGPWAAEGSGIPEPRKALRDMGKEEQEEMRRFLGGEPAATGAGHDFTVAGRKCEFKYSTVQETYRDSRAKATGDAHSWDGKPKRLGPCRRWCWHDVHGAGGNKDYEWLILRGDDRQGNEFLFLISGEEMFREPALARLSKLRATLPKSEKSESRLRGRSQFVWEHKKSRTELRKALGLDASASKSG